MFIELLTGAIRGFEGQLGSCLVEVGARGNKSQIGTDALLGRPNKTPSTKVLCIVEGPNPCSKRFQDAHKLRVTFSGGLEWSPFLKGKWASPFSPSAALEHKYLSILRQAVPPFILLEKYPKMELKCHAYIIDENVEHFNEGLLNWTLLNAMIAGFCSALCDRGIQLRDMFTSTTLCKAEDERWIIDPSIEELLGHTACMTVVQGGHQPNFLSFLLAKGLTSPEEMSAALSFVQKENSKKLAILKTNIK